MKHRIIDALVYFSKLRSEESHADLLKDVTSKTQFSEDEIQQKSLQILKYLIPNYAGFEISTIDSFNHRIIRTFAQDLNLNQNFEIDLEVKPYIDLAVDNLMEEVGKDEQLTEWLVEFIHYKINLNKSGDIQFDLKKYAELVLNENNYEALKELQQYSLKDLKDKKNQLLKSLKNYIEQLQDLAEEFFKLLGQHDIESSDFKGSYIPKYFKKLLSGEIVSKFNSNWHDIENAEFYNKTAKDTTKQKINLVRPEIEAMFLRSKDLCLQHTLKERILKSFVPLSMISHINYHLNQIKAENGILFVNDFNHIISQHIKKQPAPFIYERLGEKFKHFFIDEFQDTSKLQWQNITPLIENVLASSHDSDHSSLYLVGDVKQSIYEWRGGDPKQFLDLSQGQSNPFFVKPQSKKLDRNWRSAKSIVEFNNDFFYHAADFLTNQSHQKLYKNAKQTAQKTINGYVDIQFLPKQEDKDLQAENRVKSLQKIIRNVQSQGFSLSDICILVRKKKFGTQIAEAFNALEQPIEVISQESLLIASDSKVVLLTQFLNFVEDYSLKTSIDFLLDWLNYTNLDPKSHHDILSEAKNCDETNIFEYLKTLQIEFDFNLYDNLSLYDKAEYALRVLHLDQNANAYIQFFLDEIFEFSKKRSKSMMDFLNYWDDQKNRKSISTSETEDAVNIMTIHKSKGLQFPVVIYAHANFTLADLSQTEDWIELNQDTFGVPYTYENISESIKNLNSSYKDTYLKNIAKEELNNINTAYVCMTRAVDQLYILSEPVRGKGTSFADMLCSFLKEKHIYKEDLNHYNFGEPKTETKRNKTESKNLKVIDFQSYSAKQFYQELMADQHFKTQSEAITFGQNVHETLQNIQYASDIKHIETESEILDLVKKVVTHEKIKIYFNKPWSVFNEAEIIYNEQIIRPDRICVNNNKAVVIDYKTGKEEASHLQQLTNYKNAIEALGYTLENAILVYLRKDLYIKTL